MATFLIKLGYSSEYAKKYLHLAASQGHAGAQWDPRVVEALLRVVDARTDEQTWSLDGVGRDADAPAEHASIGCDCLPAFVDA